MNNNNSLSNSYADAMDTLLSNEEKVRLISKINETLPANMRMPERGVATTPKAFLEAITAAHLQLSRIMFSSGFNPWAGTVNANTPTDWIEMREICSFIEFREMYEKLQMMSNSYETCLKKIYGEEIDNSC